MIKKTSLIRALKRGVVLFVLIYLIFALVVVISFPRAHLNAAKSLNPQVLLAPIYAPAVILTYARLVPALATSSEAGAISLAELLERRGRWDGHGIGVVLDTSAPDLRRRRTLHGAPEGSSAIRLQSEGYSQSYVGAALGYTSGRVLTVGRNTCLLESARNLFDLFDQGSCYQIRDLGDDKYQFVGLGGAPSFVAVYDARLQGMQ